MAMPAMVPSTVAISAAVSAIRTELRAAASIASSSASLRYQSSVKPTHSAERRESLNENSTTIASGTYRNAYTASDGAHNRRVLRTWRSPARVQRRRACDREHREREHQGQHGAERPVARAEEGFLDHVADHPVVLAAEQLRNREHAEHRNEHQRRP